jgi:ribose 5-phosphate isomerase B
MAALVKNFVKTVFLAADHAGFELKEFVKHLLKRKGYSVKDFGTHSNESCDYPDFIIPCAAAVAKSKGAAAGIVFGGSGNGEQMAANKVRGIRAALCYDLQTTVLAREHNDANVLSLGSRTVTKDKKLATKIVLAFLTTAFSGEARHKRRLRKIAAYERRK